MGNIEAFKKIGFIMIDKNKLSERDSGDYPELELNSNYALTYSGVQVSPTIVVIIMLNRNTKIFKVC